MLLLLLSIASRASSFFRAARRSRAVPATRGTPRSRRRFAPRLSLAPRRDPEMHDVRQREQRLLELLQRAAALRPDHRAVFERLRRGVEPICDVAHVKAA